MRKHDGAKEPDQGDQTQHAADRGAPGLAAETQALRLGRNPREAKNPNVQRVVRPIR